LHNVLRESERRIAKIASEKMNYRVIEIKTKDAEEMGALSFCEPSKEVGFDIKRFYYIYGAPKGTQRGGHAHKELKQVLYCPYGKIRIILDDGINKEEVLLDSPCKGLVIEPVLWREMVWEEDNSVLCVEASMYYGEEDYIREYEDFLRYVKNR